jgi:hypothetical protein
MITTATAIWNQNNVRTEFRGEKNTQSFGMAGTHQGQIHTSGNAYCPHWPKAKRRLLTLREYARIRDSVENGHRLVVHHGHLDKVIHI